MIAIDIDDTIYDFSSVAKDAIFRLAHDRGDKSLLNGAYTPATQWRIPNDILGTEMWWEAIKLAHRPEVIQSQEPFQGSVETIQALADNGHRLMYISNRDPKVEEATGQWLEDCGFPMGSGTQLLCLADEKIPRMHKCQYLIDDRPKTLVLFTRDYQWHSWFPTKDRLAFGRQTPYNENLTDVPNVFLAPTWSGINYYLVKKGLLKQPAYQALGLLGEEREVART